MGFILFCKGDDYVHITSSVGESFKARLVIVAIPPHLTGERIKFPIFSKFSNKGTSNGKKLRQLKLGRFSQDFFS